MTDFNVYENPSLDGLSGVNASGEEIHLKDMLRGKRYFQNLNVFSRISAISKI